VREKRSRLLETTLKNKTKDEWSSAQRRAMAKLEDLETELMDEIDHLVVKRGD